MAPRARGRLITLGGAAVDCSGTAKAASVIVISGENDNTALQWSR